MLLFRGGMVYFREDYIFQKGNIAGYFRRS